MTRDQVVQQIKDGVTLWHGDSWIGFSNTRKEYEYYAFGGDWHERKPFSTAEELCAYMDTIDRDWFNEYMTQEEDYKRFTDDEDD